MTKNNDGETPVILDIWGMYSIPLLPLLSGPLCPGMVEPDEVISMGQIAQLNFKAVLSQTTLFSVSTQFKCQTVLFG